MNKLLCHSGLIRHIIPSWDYRALDLVLRTLNRAGSKSYIQMCMNRASIQHGYGNNYEFIVNLERAGVMTRIPETLHMRLSRTKRSELEANPEVLRAIRTMYVEAFQPWLFELNWGTNLTQVELYAPDARDFGDVQWPDSIRHLQLSANDMTSVPMKLPEGLEVFYLFVYSPFTLGPEVCWPESLLVLKLLHGRVRADPQSFPRLRSAHVRDFHDSRGQLFVPKALEGWAGIDFDHPSSVEAPNLKMAHLSGPLKHMTLRAPQLISLNVLFMTVQDELAFETITCLSIKNLCFTGQTFRFPESVLSLRLPSETQASRIVLPSKLKALKFSSVTQFDPEILTLPETLELLRLGCNRNSKNINLVLSPLPKLRFLYLDFRVHGKDPCSLAIQGRSDVLYGEVYVRPMSSSKVPVDLPLFGFSTPLLETSFRIAKPGTPLWCPRDPSRMLRILE